MSLSRDKVSSITIGVCTVGLIDMLTTIYWYASGQITEANPLMAALLRLGAPACIAFKVATLVIYAVVMGRYEKQNPRRAQVLGLIALYAYVVAYVTFVFRANIGRMLG